jgi:hypothetical protein
MQLSNACILSQFDSVLAQPYVQFFAVESAEWDRRNVHDKTIAMAQETIAKNLSRVFQSELVHGLIQGTHQHQTPKPFDGPFSLAVCKQPVAEWWISFRTFAKESKHSPDDAKFLHRSQIVGTKKGTAKVKWCRPGIGLEYAPAMIGRDEIKFGLWCEKGIDAYCFAEVCEVRATSHADVLAGIHQLP